MPLYEVGTFQLQYLENILQNLKHQTLKTESLRANITPYILLEILLCLRLDSFLNKFKVYRLIIAYLPLLV